MNRADRVELLEALRALLDAVERGELDADTPKARAMVRQIEGAAAMLEQEIKR